MTLFALIAILYSTVIKQHVLKKKKFITIDDENRFKSHNRLTIMI